MVYKVTVYHQIFPLPLLYMSILIRILRFSMRVVNTYVHMMPIPTPSFLNRLFQSLESPIWARLFTILLHFQAFVDIAPL